METEGDYDEEPTLLAAYATEAEAEAHFTAHNQVVDALQAEWTKYINGDEEAVLQMGISVDTRKAYSYPVTIEDSFDPKELQGFWSTFVFDIKDEPSASLSQNIKERLKAWREGAPFPWIISGTVTEPDTPFVISAPSVKELLEKVSDYYKAQGV